MTTSTQQAWSSRSSGVWLRPPNPWTSRRDARPPTSPSSAGYGCATSCRRSTPRSRRTAGFRYDKTERKAKPVRRNPTQRHNLYRETLARTTLRSLADVFDVAPPSLVDSAAVNGYLAVPDPSSGQPTKLTMVSVHTSRQALAEMNLAEPTLDPERCLGRLGGRISLQPHNRIPVSPMLAWIDVADHKVVDPASAAVSDRLDLLSLNGEQFEQLVERLFTAMGYKAWHTTYSHDGGVDVYASIEDPVHGVKASSRPNGAPPASTPTSSDRCTERRSTSACTRRSW